MNLRDYQRCRLTELRSLTFRESPYRERVTLLAYIFPLDAEGEAFDWIEFSVLQSWMKLGRLRTVIVAPRHFSKLDAFVKKYDDVEVKIAPGLVPGEIKSMSLDCLCNLWRYFDTPRGAPSSE